MKKRVIMYAVAVVMSITAIGVRAAAETDSAAENNIRQAAENIDKEMREPPQMPPDGNGAEGRGRNMPERNGQPGGQPEAMNEETVQGAEQRQNMPEQSTQSEEQSLEITAENEQTEEQQPDMQNSEGEFEEHMPPEMPGGGRGNFGEEMMNREEQSQSFLEENFTVISAGVLLAAAFAFVLLYKRRQY